MDVMKTVSILGATGSIGRSTADVILSRPEAFDVQALTAGSGYKKLAEMAVALKAKRAVIADPSAYKNLKDALSGAGIEAAAGHEALLEAAAMPAEWIMAAVVGMAGLLPLMRAIEQGTCVAIANKEPLVAAGPLVMDAARRHGATILPVDSEHNAIFQVFDRERPQGIARLILTASGGPFRTWTKEQMQAATPQQAVAHPNWSMGAKISVDSASMMNKALEVIEAHYLYDMPPEKISVLVHPQSIIHSMVEYLDGSVLAQLGAPDMRTPIAHTLAWPQRMTTPGQRLDWAALKRLDFEPLDSARFPAVGLAYEALGRGLWACVALNAANEVAVAEFLAGKCGFWEIVNTIGWTMESLAPVDLPSINHIIDYDGEVRGKARTHLAETRSKKAG